MRKEKSYDHWLLSPVVQRLVSKGWLVVKDRVNPPVVVNLQHPTVEKLKRNE